MKFKAEELTNYKKVIQNINEKSGKWEGWDAILIQVVAYPAAQGTITGPEDNRWLRTFEGRIKGTVIHNEEKMDETAIILHARWNYNKAMRSNQTTYS